MDAGKEEKEEWPSQRVPKGGIFNLPKAQYSKATHDFLNLLMEEQKLSIMQRNKINYILRCGKPLPVAHAKTKRKMTTDCFPGFDNMRMKNARRRTLDAIKATGGYDRTKFKPTTFESTEEKKIRLQEKMSGLKHQFSAPKDLDCTKHEEKEEQIDPVDELLHEIQERVDWLEEMEKLGEGDAYKTIIKSEIEQRLRLIKRLSPDSNITRQATHV